MNDLSKIKKLVLKNKFNIEDIVYHLASEERGVIIMVRIVVDSTHKAIYQYLVSCGIGHSGWEEEIELRSEPVLV